MLHNNILVVIGGRRIVLEGVELLEELDLDRVDVPARQEGVASLETSVSDGAGCRLEYY